MLKVTGKVLPLVVAGYVLSVLGGIVAVALNELFISEEIQQTSGGMVAFGDVVLFVFVTGLFSLLPTWFLLRLWVRNSPRSLIVAELALAAAGPVSWLAMVFIGSLGPHPGPPPAALPWIGPLIAFVAIPRIVSGPIMIAIEGATIFLVDERQTRRLLGLAMLGDLIPMAAFVLHMRTAVGR
jgi:hypothetical protein